MSQTPNDPNTPSDSNEGWRQPPQQGWNQSPQQGYGHYPQQGVPVNMPIAPKPGSVALRPLSLGDIFEGTFKSFKYAPLAIIVPLLLVNVILSVAAVRYLMYWATQNLLPIVDRFESSGPVTIDSPSEFSEIFTPEFINSFWVLGLAMAIISILGTFVMVFCYGIIAVSVARGIAGQKTSLGQAIRLAGRGLPGLLGIAGILTLLYIAGTFAAIAILVNTLSTYANQSSPFAGALVPALFLAPLVGLAIILMSVKLFAPPLIAAVEEVGPLRAIGRSWSLTRFNFWRVLGILLLMGIITSAAIGIVSAPFQALTQTSYYSINYSDLDQVRAILSNTSWAQAILSGITSGLSSIIMTVVASVLYFDLRFRHEQLHFTIAREVESGNQPEIPGDTAQASTMR